MRVKNIIQFSVGPIGAAVLGLLTLPFVAWFFSPVDVGRMTMLQVVLGLSVSFFSLEMYQAYVREYHEVDDKHTLFKTAVLPGLVLTLFIFLVLLLLPVSFSEILFGIDSWFLTLLLLLAMFCSFLINFLAHVIRMQERGLAFSATQITPKAILLFLIGLILLLNLDSEFKWLMLINTVALFTSLIIFAFITRDTWLPAITANFDKRLLKQMLSFSLPLIPGGLAFWGLTTMDRFFIRALSGFDELGVYAVSVGLAAAVSVLSTVFSNIWHPVVYKWVKDGVEPKRVQLVIENMLIVVALIWSLIGLFSWVIPYFLPSHYKAIEYIIVACVAMPLFYMLSETTVIGIGMTRRTGFAMLASISAFIVNIFLNYLLIPIYGAAGAALATLISFFVFFIIRTESTAWLWHSFPRFKMYLLLILYVTLTSIMVITKANLEYFNLLWFFLFFLTLCIHKVRVFESLSYLKNYFQRRC